MHKKGIHMIGKIILMAHSFSVVVKSIEKGLASQGYEVIPTDANLYGLTELMEDADALLVYLPDSLMSNDRKVGSLSRLCETLEVLGRNMILIGSHQSHDSFLHAVPELDNYTWMDRPIDMDELLEKIDLEITARHTDSKDKRILIIDDDPVYAKMTAEWLSEDYQVDTVTDGMKGIGFLLDNKVDLILLDYEMPIVDGSKILGMLRSSPETRDIPVIFLTGIQSKESIQKVLALKPQGYLLKSITKQKLLSNLKEIFAKQQIR